MDHQSFDHVTRVFAAAGSRRAALRALLGAALLGASTRAAMATSSTPCREGNEEPCGGECCPGKCFVSKGSTCALCCTGKGYVMCAGKTIDASTRETIREPTCCVDDGSEDPCLHCVPPPPPDGQICSGYVGGSYRRR
jgi:hypothetical protein